MQELITYFDDVFAVLTGLPPVRPIEHTIDLLPGAALPNAPTSRYPLPRINDLLYQLKGARFFTKMDLTAGYNKMRMASSDTRKTSFKTKYGLSLEGSCLSVSAMLLPPLLYFLMRFAGR